MPLRPGMPVKEAIHELSHFGSRPRSHEQIVAIALSNARRKPQHAGFGGNIMSAPPAMPSGQFPLNAHPDGNTFSSGAPGGGGAGWFNRGRTMQPMARPMPAPAHMADGGVDYSVEDLPNYRALADMIARDRAANPEDWGDYTPLPKQSPEGNLPGRITLGHDAATATGWPDELRTRALNDYKARMGFYPPDFQEQINRLPTPRQKPPEPHKQVAAQHLAGGGFSMAQPSMPFYDRALGRTLYDEPWHPGGLIESDTAGRTDRLPYNVAADSFVLPADVVSGLGQGNTLAGAKIMDAILNSGAPYGASLPRHHRAQGGSTPGTSKVILAGGEYLIPRKKLEEIGGHLRRGRHSRARSDLAAGHEWARGFVSNVRKHSRRFINNAPKPKA